MKYKIKEWDCIKQRMTTWIGEFNSDREAEDIIEYYGHIERITEGIGGENLKRDECQLRDCAPSRA